MLFVRALTKKTIPGRFRTLPFLFEGLRLLPKGLTVARKANKAYLTGATEDEVRAWAERLFSEQVEPRLGSRGREWIERERTKARAIVLLSGMPEPLLVPIGRHFDADHLLGTELAVRPDGRYTGRRAGPHPYGAAKLEVALKLARKEGWALADCSAYGDHATDAILLAAVGEAYAVDPDPGLRTTAERYGWTILGG